MQNSGADLKVFAQGTTSFLRVGGRVFVQDQLPLCPLSPLFSSSVGSFLPKTNILSKDHKWDMSKTACINENGEYSSKSSNPPSWFPLWRNWLKLVKIVKSVKVHSLWWNFVECAIFVIAGISGHKWELFRREEITFPSSGDCCFWLELGHGIHTFINKSINLLIYQLIFLR